MFITEISKLHFLHQKKNQSCMCNIIQRPLTLYFTSLNKHSRTCTAHQLSNKDLHRSKIYTCMYTRTYPLSKASSLPQISFKNGWQVAKDEWQLCKFFSHREVNLNSGAQALEHLPFLYNSSGDGEALWLNFGFRRLPALKKCVAWTPG